jgi:branched-chain amino acid transport system substrate-binding protein
MTMTVRDRSRRGRRRSVPALLAAAALLVAACASDDTTGAGGSGGGSGDAPDPAEVLGEERPASGEPIQVGYIYDGTTDVIDNAPELAAAEAATEYVNDYLGGVAGRPIELNVCSTDQTPSGGSDCVRQMESDRMPVVLNGVTGQAAVVFRPLNEAGIPTFTPSAGDPSILTSPLMHIMGNGLAALVAGPAQLAADAEIDRAALVAIDVPAASGALEAAAPSVFENAGVELDLVMIPPDTPDMTPNIAAELENDPGQIEVVGDPNFCAKAMDAIAAAGFDGQIVVIPQCMDQALLESATNLEGAILPTYTTTDPDSEEFQLYNAVMETYADSDAERGGVAPGGYQAVVGFARAMEGLRGDVTPESVQSAFTSMEATPMPLADGITYKCDGQQVAVVPAFCSTDALWTELDAEGNGTEFQVLDGESLPEMG